MVGCLKSKQFSATLKAVTWILSCFYLYNIIQCFLPHSLSVNACVNDILGGLSREKCDGYRMEGCALELNFGG